IYNHYQHSSKKKDLKKKIDEVASYEKEIYELGDKIREVEAMHDNVDRKIGNYDSQKLTLQTIDAKFNRLVDLSNGMDTKIADLIAQSDNLVNMQAMVSNFQDSLEKIQKRYDRIETKGQTIDSVAKTVDVTQGKIADLEKRLLSCNRQVDKLPEEIQKMQDNVKFITANSEKVDDVAAKIDSLQGVIDKANDKIDEFDSTREEMDKLYNRIEEISKEADNQLEALHDIVREMSKKGSSISSAAKPTLGQRERVIELKRQGWSVREIAQALKIQENMVSLILELGSGSSDHDEDEDEEDDDLPPRRRRRS
ncbi:MAG: hypothetical protein II837_02280, partial [Treponema sp.]|nr:hypothetical protein [Treponema sp.]